MKKLSLVLALVVVASFVLSACATVPPERSPKTFLEERRATEAILDDAKELGVADECPMAYTVAAWKHHAAVDVFWSCNTAKAIKMMKEARAMAKGLCGEAPMVEQKAWVIGDANFDYDRAEIKSGERKVLNDAVKVMKENPDMKFILHGHTDSRGPESYNMDLSYRRASAVKKYLTDRGISAGRLSTVGHGESQPVAANDTPAGRAKNRRVEIEPVQ